jgi:hypothetical protein
MPAAKKTVPTPTDGEVAITIQPPKTVEFEVLIVGTSPLIMHAWSEKAKAMMRDKQQGKKAAKKEPKDPRAEWNGGRLLNEAGRDCISAMCFKNAIVDTASFIDGITKVQLRGSVFILGDLVPIDFDADPTSPDKKSPHMREDMVRVGMGVADIRYRPEYRNWSCKLRIRHMANVISTQDVMTLLSTAGLVNGMGEMRPQKTGGSFGTFEVKTA